MQVVAKAHVLIECSACNKNIILDKSRTNKRFLMKKFIIAIAVFMSLPTFAQSGDAALEAAQQGDYAKALSIWRPLAEQGNAAAQFNLGLMYEKGDGVPRDEQEAARWYYKAALQGHVGAQLNLGTLYDEGKGVVEDNRKAAQWYNQAASKGEVAASTNIDLMRQFGEEVFEGELPPELEPGETIEEIVVWGDMSMGALRGKLRIAEDRAFSLFNDLNTKPEFEIRCEYKSRVGSNLKKRVCNPNYVDQLYREAAFNMRQGFGSARPSKAAMDSKRAELLTEIIRLGQEHPELLDAMNDMTYAKRAVQTESSKRGIDVDEAANEDAGSR